MQAEIGKFKIIVITKRAGVEVLRAVAMKSLSSCNITLGIQPEFRRNILTPSSGSIVSQVSKNCIAEFLIIRHDFIENSVIIIGNMYLPLVTSVACQYAVPTHVRSSPMSSSF
jgi:hypothetical protein